MRNSLVKISNKEKHMKLFEHFEKELALCWVSPIVFIFVPIK